MNIGQRLNKKEDKISFYYDYGRGPGQRPPTGVFIYTHPKNQIQKNHNKQALALLEVKKSELTIDEQATGSGFIPMHKFKSNFVDYYADYVKQNKCEGNRHLEGSLTQFKEFIKKNIIAPVDITETFCKRFRQHLLNNLTGEIPANYFSRFKAVMKAATKDGYYRYNPCDGIAAKKNPRKKLKENLEVEEYLLLLKTPYFNQEIKEGFIFCCYTGLRFVDVAALRWQDIKDGKLTSRIIQAKTGEPVVLTLHPIARAILEKRRKNRTAINNADKIFHLPSANGCNKGLQLWITRAGIQKYITWSCARLSFSILLQDKNVDTATVACLLGHTTTEYVNTTYKRHRPKNQEDSISQLPAPEQMPYFLNLN